jgi:hypothetical protein
VSVVSYNGITLPYAYATQFRKIPVRDPQGDTDWCKLRFEISVQCLVNVNYLPLMAPDLIEHRTAPVNGVTNAAAVLTQIRDRLLTHRKRLSYTFNGVEMIPKIQEGNEGSVDAENGPKPQDCRILWLTSETFIIIFSIVAHYWESRGGQVVRSLNVPGNNVLYNRWTETAEIDHANFVRRVREGTYAIRSDNVDGVIADQIRSDLAVVGVPKGFLREMSKYTVTEDGLRLKYHVTDKEQFRMPPSPAFKAKGHYYETLGRTGAKLWGQVYVALEGDKLTSQASLMTKAVSVGMSYLTKRMDAIGTSFQVVENAGAKIEFYENKVEFSCRVYMSRTPAGMSFEFLGGKNNNTLGGNFPITILGGAYVGVPGSEPGTDYTPQYLDRGTAGSSGPGKIGQGLLLRSCAYYDPALRNNRFDPERGQYEQGKEIGTAGVEA